MGLTAYRDREDAGRLLADLLQKWLRPPCVVAGTTGFDAASKKYVDLLEAGIVDPAKVVRVALENAVSVASLLLLTEATMTEVPENEKETVPALE